MLAASGDIRPDDWRVLKTHLDECVLCRTTFADMAEIHAKWLPQRPGFEIYRDEQSDARHRERILKNVAKAGAHFSRSARKSPSTPEAAWRAKRSWAVLVAGFLMFCLGVGLLIQQRWLAGGATQTVANLTVPAPKVEIQGSPNGEQLERYIADSRAEQSRLSSELAAQERKVATLGDFNANANRIIADLRTQLEAARSTQHKVEADLADLRAKYDTADAIAAVQQSEIQNLNRKLSDQAASFERERQLASVGGREVRDLIAARNLHIIDVYDTDSKGKTSSAFGRIFYTEGKSLIFYAYDLNGKQADTSKMGFYVWGKRDGAPHDVKGLGVLAKDDHLQKRWVFTTTDTKVLAAIDSVFVTVEPNGRPNAKPNGKPLLSAYLGTGANHP